MSYKRILLGVAAVFVCTGAGVCFAATITVNGDGSGDYTTIQAAINAASNGDEIEVASGTYEEAINFNGKSVRLYSIGGPGGTTINGNGRLHVVKCVSGEDASTILEGFTITGGLTDNYGGGMLNAQSSPTVINCNFIGNSAYYGGGGMCNYDNSSPTVTNCTFTGNYSGSMGGGGMHNEIEGSNPIVTNCTFSGNSGIGMCNSYSSPMVTNCTFSGNSSVGMSNLFGSIPTVTNCILWGDSPPEILNLDSSANVTYSNVEGGWSGIGNIDANPLFVDAAAGNLRLRDLSPCADSGNNNAVPAGVTTDLDGNPRFVDDAGICDTGYGSAPIVDMGAYERQISSVGPICNVTEGFYYLQIQAAIDAASNGDEIEVAPGTYNESINFNGKAVRLYSSGGPEVTTIDASGLSSSVVSCVSAEDANSILEGFTLTGGSGTTDGEYRYGGGMYNNGSSPTISNCTFSGNSADIGGGMYNSGSSPMVTNCTFSSNSGGGMVNWESSSPTVTNCTFSDNTAINYGGGMVNWGSSSPTVTNCTFSGNSASGFMAGLGGGMYNFQSSPTLTNCTFSDNTAGDDGGGMYNTFNSSPRATNCILWDDSPNEIVDGDIFSSSTVRYSDVQGGWGGTGNVDVGPEFVDAYNGDYHLQWGSPCVDAGDPGFVAGEGDVDIDGEPRVMGGRVDMGADEVGEKQADFTRDGRIDISDLAVLGGSWDTQEGEPNWYVLSDLFEDGAIGLDDLAMFVDDWMWMRE